MPVWGSYAKAQTVEPYAVFDAATGTLTFKCDDAKPNEAYPLNKDYEKPLWISYHKDAITNVVFDASFAKARPTTCCYWFYECENLTEIEGIENLNTENVTDMGFMFGFCSGLTSLDVSNFDTKNVSNMKFMFCGCSGLTSLDVSKFDTKNVTDMNGMFGRCSGLTSLDVSKFDTKNVTDMNGMFGDCSGLTSLDVSKFDTKNVWSMGSMFQDCSGLTSLDVSKFDTKNVRSMGSMFYHCSGLTSLDVSKFDTKNVTDMIHMFNGCSGLTTLDVSKFDTQNVRWMNYMFCGCSGLTTLDLSNFNTRKYPEMYKMFYNCSNLKTIYVSDKFVTTDVYYDEDMFLGCLSLKGAIAYDENKTDSRYANTTDGYFTLKNASGINALTTPNNETTEYFNLLGVRANNKHKGINIVRRGNQTMKVLVK